MSDRTLEQIMDGFTPNPKTRQEETTLTLWVPVSLKDRYKKMQRASGRTFSKLLCELVEAAIEKAEKKTA